ncbi:MAG: 3-isopropylmalate dehydratase large subunit [Ignavibacteriales bacterium]|nr:3-isopropylmalate dehydratase large subunit [Ignavibacteriales bacterium]
MSQPLTLFQKVWNAHVVAQEKDSPAVLYIDLQLVHEVTSPQAFEGLRRRGLKVRRPDRTVGTMDHSIPTLPPSLRISDELAAKQMRQMEVNAQEFGFRLYGKDHPQRGIVHVIGPELGFTQPGMTIVCGDSHTATHGAFGALAFGIGTSEVEHVLATQCLLQRLPKTMEVRIEGKLSKGVTAKDIILALLAKIGVGGGTGHVIEYTGSTVRSLSMEERMTVCNMSIEGGARAGMMAPDDKTFEFLANREFAPKGDAWEKAMKYWRSLPTDAGAIYDTTVLLDVSNLVPMLTFGTNPGMGLPVTGRIPDPSKMSNASERQTLEKSLQYMGFQPNEPLSGKKIDVVFIGSCTNSRISDLREAARVFLGRKVAPNVRTMVVPGSQEIKRQAEAEGLHKVFIDAGAEWRESGCSMCIAMNGDEIKAGQYAVSTSNRNFEGRQGKGGRTLLASPLTAAAAAVTGKITDVRTLLTD